MLLGFIFNCLSYFITARITFTCILYPQCTDLYHIHIITKTNWILLKLFLSRQNSSTPSSSDSEGALKTNQVFEFESEGKSTSVNRTTESGNIVNDGHDDEIPTKPPRRRSQGSTTSSTPRAKEKPQILPKPKSIRSPKRPSVDEILESVVPPLPVASPIPYEGEVSPLRPNSFSLLKDTVTSLCPEVQQWLVSDAELEALRIRNSFSQESGERTIQGKSITETFPANGRPDCDPRGELRNVNGPFDCVLQDLKGFPSNRGLHSDNTPTDLTRGPSEKSKLQQNWVAFE